MKTEILKKKSTPNKIFRSFGLAEFKDKKVTDKLVFKIYDEPDKIILHNNFSYELKYIKIGLSFFYLKEDININFQIPEKKKKSKSENQENKENLKDEQKNSKKVEEIENIHEIFMISFMAPFSGLTEEYIKLNHSTMEEVFRKLGKENWITTLDRKYWWVEHSGIYFYIENEDEDLTNIFNEEEFLKRPITRISVPLMEYTDDGIKNELGLEKLNPDDFCIDGKLHEPIIDSEKAEMICAKCGLILSERMISMENSGQRAFSTEERNKREQHGSPMNPLMPDMQLSTMIDKRATMPENLRKAVKWDSRYSWKQRNMIQATSEIKRIGELLNLPQHVKIYAVNLYRKAFQLGLLKGRSIKAMVAASLYYACGAEKIPRTLGEIAKVTDSSFHNITRCYQSLIKELNLPSPTINPNLLVSKYVTNLKLDYRIQILAGKILNKYEKVYTLSGKDPKGLVAAAIYIAAHHYQIKISQTKISRSIGITEVTLRNRLNEMKKFISNYKKK
ncbi:MAG: transcription initiation factor IIB [Promethearchaeota archaeon]